MLTKCNSGNFDFIKSGVLSVGCVPHDGYEIVHATFRNLPSLERGYELLEQHMNSIGRPINAVCGVELRMPQPSIPSDFAEFNSAYAEQMKAWGMYMDDVLPTTRTNVAFEVLPPAEPGLYGFYYTIPSEASRKTFVVSGAADVRRTPDKGAEIVALHDLSAQGMGQKAWYVLQVLEGRLESLGVDWTDASTINLYTVQDISFLMGSVIIPRFGPSFLGGLSWHFMRPPTVDLEFEMDAHASNVELVLDV